MGAGGKPYEIPTAAYLVYQPVIEAAISFRAVHWMDGSAWTTRDIVAPLDPSTQGQVLRTVLRGQTLDERSAGGSLLKRG